MREIVLDTETTGLSPKDGHRIVEIGCVELKNHLPTGETYHVYINPERDMPTAAFNVHGLSEEFLKKHKPFRDVASDFLNFLGDAPLIIHNARFDMTFINAELRNHKYKPISMSRAIDTLDMARQKFPGSPASLDALCRRFNIDLSKRSLHGALLDSELLAAVYLELIGGRQPSFGLTKQNQSKQVNKQNKPKKHFEKRSFSISEAEMELHKAFLEKIDNPLWNE